jgi:ABC-2 type transport system permease protein
MKQYPAMFKLKLIEGMQYRAAAWAGISTQFFWGFMLIMVYQAFYRSSAEPQPLNFKQLVAMLWLNQAFLALIMVWWQDNDLLDSITNGHVVYELCRPYDMYSFWFARLIGTRLSRVALRFLPILVIAFLLPEPYRMSLPASWDAFALFILSMVLSLLLVSALSMFVYVLTFITLSSSGAKLLVAGLQEFLGGAYIAIPLMPKWLQIVCNFFPFRYMSDLPFRIYSGNIIGSGAYTQICAQAAWIVGLILLGRLSFSRIARRIVIQGG